jgi:hypothetical protein
VVPGKGGLEPVEVVAGRGYRTPYRSAAQVGSSDVYGRAEWHACRTREWNAGNHACRGRWKLSRCAVAAGGDCKWSVHATTAMSLRRSWCSNLKTLSCPSLPIPVLLSARPYALRRMTITHLSSGRHSDRFHRRTESAWCLSIRSCTWSQTCSAYVSSRRFRAGLAAAAPTARQDCTGSSGPL